MSSFPCTACGACCRRVAAVDKDWPTREDGACLHLTADNRCAIYADRPEICRVDARRPSGFSEEQWHRLNAIACNQMQEADGIGPDLRVPVETEKK